MQLTERNGGDTDVGRTRPAEQRCLDHHSGERERGVVARHVQGRDDEQVPQGAPRLRSLAVRGEPVTEPLPVHGRIGGVQAAESERGANRARPLAS